MSMKHQQVGTYQGLPYYRDPVDGYYWQNGGFCDTAEEVKAEIAEFNAGNADVPDDDPCLPEPWWTYR